MQRNELFAQALISCEELLQQYPQDQAISSIIKQLEYLLELEEGRRADWERLDEIIIGILTVREIEPLNRNTAKLLYEVCDVVTSMIDERRRSMLE